MSTFALTKILKEECEFNDQNLLRMKRSHEFKIRELIDKDGSLFLTVDSLISINNIITGSNNLHLRRVHVKPAGYDKNYMDASKIEGELYIVVDKFNDRLITPSEFCRGFLYKIHPFADGNGRTCKILFSEKL